MTPTRSPGARFSGRHQPHDDPVAQKETRVSDPAAASAAGTPVGPVQRLVQLGLLDPHHTGDDALDAAVRRFQQNRGLTATGVLDPTTRSHLDEARWALGDRVLWYAAGHPFTGDDVTALQHRLLGFGFDVGRVDGVFGPRTDHCLRDFQSNVGLSTDGACGPETFAALRRLSRPRVSGGRADALREQEKLHRAGPGLPGKVVIIDPGHGGGDAGTSGWGLIEAEVTLDLANRVVGRLRAVGVTAYLTRSELARDEVLDEVERARFANATEADLVISLHCNAHRDPAADGVATYFYGSPTRGSTSTIGERFAGLVQRELVARTGLRDCRSHAGPLDLLRFTAMPAVRVEIGYLTSPVDSAALAEDEVRDAMADALVVAVQRVYLPPEADAPTGMLRLSELAGHTG